MESRLMGGSIQGAHAQAEIGEVGEEREFVLDLDALLSVKYHTVGGRLQDP